MIERSAVESNRFRLAVGRAMLESDGQIAAVLDEAERFDVVIVRARADWSAVPVRLGALAGFRLLPADHLLVWECAIPVVHTAPLPSGWSIGPPRDAADVLEVVRDSFRNYASHYSMNPLFDATDVLDGYCEWAVAMSADAHTWTLVVYGDDATPVGVALVDHSSDTPDIRLAGMTTDVQGGGHYAALIGAISELAAESGHRRVQISTQSTNLRVMRAWSRIGFLPVSTTATYHLTRASLLDLT